MSSKLKNYLILFLACTTVGVGFQLFRARQQLADARKAPSLEVKKTEINTSAAPAPTLVDRAPEAPAASPVAEPSETAPAGAPPDRQGGPGGNRGARFGAAMAELMKDPEFAAALKLDQEARIDNRYSTLFKQLNLPPEQLAALKSLLAERENANRDVWASAAAQGLNPRDNRDELRQLTADLQAEVDENIKTTLGENVYGAIENYNNTAPQRNVVSDFNQKLAITGASLSDSQSQQLTNIIAETAQSSGRNVIITDATIARAQAVLTPAQVSTLTQLQAEQNARQIINEKTQALRQQVGGGGGGWGDGGGRPRNN
jgi:hypothetical protein